MSIVNVLLGFASIIFILITIQLSYIPKLLAGCIEHPALSLTDFQNIPVKA